MLQVYFIRHGQSTNNAFMEETHRDNYLLGREADPDLTSAGREQIKLVAEYLARSKRKDEFDPQNREGFGLTHLYCSLMVRAIKTGQAISEATGLPLVAWPEVHETGGIFDVEMVDGEPDFIGKPGPGRSFFKSEFPDLVIPENLPEEGWWAGKKESRGDYLVRAHRIIDGLIDKHGGTDHRIGIVTHGGIFNRIITALFEFQVENYWILLNNCGVSRIDIREDGRVVLAYLNKVDFLPDHLVT